MPAQGDAIVVRTALPADAAAVAALCGALGHPIPHAQAEAHSAEPRGLALLVAEDGGEVVGWIELAERRTVEIGDAGEIQELVVRSDRRGQDIGTTLLRAAEPWARRRGLPRVRVRSNVIRDRTHRFHLQRGYVERKRQVVFDKLLGGDLPEP